MSGLIPDFGNILYTAGAFIIALSIIVAVHEFGHYIVGRWSGIAADVFSLGFGPKLISRVDKRGTRWQIALIPLGGYVKFRGDANAASAGVDEAALQGLSAEERRATMQGAPLWARAATVAAGPVFNFILSMIILTAMALYSGSATTEPQIGTLNEMPEGTGDVKTGDVIRAVGGIETPDYDALFKASETLPSSPSLTYLVTREGADLNAAGPALYPARLDGIAPGSAAAEAGLQPGDVVIRADGMRLYEFSDLQEQVKLSQGQPMTLEVWRPGMAADEVLTVTLTPRSTDMPLRDGGFEARYLIGATGGYFFTPALRPTGVVEAVTGAANEVWFVMRSSVSGMWHMATGAISSCNLRGPLGIAESSGAAAGAGATSFIWFIAMLSTAVGLLNLFPIPVLDGGHLVFHAYEAITRRPPSEKVLNLLYALGGGFVLVLMLFGLTNDLFC